MQRWYRKSATFSHLTELTPIFAWPSSEIDNMRVYHEREDSSDWPILLVKIRLHVFTRVPFNF